MSKVSAVTFDLWDTILIDDSDEPKRKAAGRPPKSVERRMLIHQFLEKHTSIPGTHVDISCNAVDAAFRKAWYEHHVTWSVRERLNLVLKGLKKTLPEPEMTQLIQTLEEMELEFRPDFVHGIKDALKALKEKFKLGVISDTVFSPGRTLRTILAGEGILDLFDILIFSDEAGISKPEPSIFKAAYSSLGINPAELVHIGDREKNDISGAHLIGARAVLCTAVINRGSGSTAANAVFNNYRDLPEIINKLNN